MAGGYIQNWYVRNLVHYLVASIGSYPLDKRRLGFMANQHWLSLTATPGEVDTSGNANHYYQSGDSAFHDNSVTRASDTFFARLPAGELVRQSVLSAASGNKAELYCMGEFLFQFLDQWGNENELKQRELMRENMGPWAFDQCWELWSKLSQFHEFDSSAPQKEQIFDKIADVFFSRIDMLSTFGDPVSRPPKFPVSMISVTPGSTDVDVRPQNIGFESLTEAASAGDEALNIISIGNFGNVFKLDFNKLSNGDFKSLSNEQLANIALTYFHKEAKANVSALYTSFQLSYSDSKMASYRRDQVAVAQYQSNGDFSFIGSMFRQYFFGMGWLRTAGGGYRFNDAQINLFKTIFLNQCEQICRLVKENENFQQDTPLPEFYRQPVNWVEDAWKTAKSMLLRPGGVIALQNKTQTINFNVGAGSGEPDSNSLLWHYYDDALKYRYGFFGFYHGDGYGDDFFVAAYKGNWSSTIDVQHGWSDASSGDVGDAYIGADDDPDIKNRMREIFTDPAVTFATSNSVVHGFQNYNGSHTKKNANWKGPYTGTWNIYENCVFSDDGIFENWGEFRREARLNYKANWFWQYRGDRHREFIERFNGLSAAEWVTATHKAHVVESDSDKAAHAKYLADYSNDMYYSIGHQAQFDDPEADYYYNGLCGKIMKKFEEKIKLKQTRRAEYDIEFAKRKQDLMTTGQRLANTDPDSSDFEDAQVQVNLATVQFQLLQSMAESAGVVDSFGNPIPISIDDLYKEATTVMGWSFAIGFACAHRDEIAFKTIDKLIEMSRQEGHDDWYPSSGDLEDIREGVEQALNAGQQQAAAAAAEQLSKDDELSKEQIEERQVFYKQCFLLANMDLFKEEFQRDVYTKTTNGTDPGAANIHAGLKQGEGLEYGGRIKMVDIDSGMGKSTRAEIINKLVSPKGKPIDQFFSMTPDIISALVPKIRLFRVFNDDVGTLREIEFDFPNHMNPDDNQYRASYLSLGEKKADGSYSSSQRQDKWDFGIKEITLSFEGSSPATSTKDIVVDMSMFFRDFTDLIKKRRLGTYYEFIEGRNDDRLLDDEFNLFSYLDLILFPISDKKPQIDGVIPAPFQYDPANYRIRLDVGWMKREDPSFRSICESRGLSMEMLNEAIDKINKSYYLNMIDHDLDFKNDGSVEIKVKMRAFMESATQSIAMDAISTPELNSLRKILKEEKDRVLPQCTPEGVLELLNIYQQIELEFLKKSYQSIFARLMMRQRIFYCFAHRKSRNEFAKYGFFSNIPPVYDGQKTAYSIAQTNVNIAEQVKGQAKDPENIVANSFTLLDGELKNLTPETVNFSNDNEYEIVNFFYFGDLIHTLMDCMYEAPDPTGTATMVGKIKDDVRNTVVILPSFDYIGSDGESHHINMAEIPVSLDYFLEFFTKNVLEGERQSYPLMHFIKDLCNRLIVDLFADLCFSSNVPVKSMYFKSTTIMGVSQSPPDDDGFVLDPLGPQSAKYFPNTRIIDLERCYESGIVPLKTNLGDRPIEQSFNYIIVYPATDTDNSNRRGDRDSDEESGIRHLFVGAGEGLLKSISFSKVDMQYLREARYFNHGYDNLMQLGAVYKASIDMVGNTMFYPGMSVFVNPTTLSPDPNDMDPSIGPLSVGGASIANALGIGGYHIVTKVKTTIGRGKFNTNVEAIFDYAGDGTRTDTIQNNAEPDEEKTPREQGLIAARSYGGLPEGADDRACRAVSSARLQHLSDLYNPAYQTNIAAGKPDGVAMEDYLFDNANNIASQASNAKAQQKAANEKAFADSVRAEAEVAQRKIANTAGTE